MFRICLGLVLVAAAWEQGGDDPLSFEVASVKPSGPGEQSWYDGGPGPKDPSRLTITGHSLRILVTLAYGIDDDQLSAPAWMNDVRFDIAAKIPPGATKEQFRQMFQNLLLDRFRMQVHHETRVVPVYELTVAKNGAKLKPAEQASDAGPEPSPGPPTRGRGGFPILPPGRMNVVGLYGQDGVHVTFRRCPIDLLVRNLQRPDAAGRRVVDKTGLTGKYDFTLFYRPSNFPQGTGEDAPDIEQAVQQQLGLKLVPSKASIEVLVIDHAEKMATEN